ncbi:MAG TPA: glycosyltransferase family 4 protein [Chloroflexota bacterium]|nr:glycosyltransferase family 4 protein [Chloroflexota bacterium]
MASVALVAHWDWVLYHFRLPLAQRLRARGATVTFICPPGPYVPGLQAAGFRWLPWPVARRSLHPLREARAVARLARLYRRERFAAVQHFTIKPILYGSLAARRAGGPVVLNTFTGLGFLFSRHPLAAALRVAVLPLLRGLLHAPATYTVFQNPADQARLVGTRLVPAARARLIPGTGVDVQRFAPAPAGANDAAPVALLAARLLWDKGVGEFVAAARQLRAAGVAAQFWVAGAPDPGNPACIPAAQLARWQAEGAVTFLGPVADMPALLRQAAVAVLPSYYPEGAPRFLMEAAAAGLPLVGSDIPGCRMVIEPGVNGLLVPPRDAAALAAALARLLRDPAARAAMGRASRALAVARFDEQVLLDAYEALYREAGVL